MAKGLCRLMNASTEISGYAFEPVDGGMLSEELPDEVAERFAGIKGFSPYVEKKGKKGDAAKTPQADQDAGSPATPVGAPATKQDEAAK